MQNVLLSSLSRIADFDDRQFETRTIPRQDWSTGDYVIGVVESARGPLAHVELADGRMTEVVPGDRVLGALGVRYATLEAVGSWQEIGDDGEMELLTSAGLFGRATSVSGTLPSLVSLRYCGHLTRGEDKLSMSDFALQANDTGVYTSPTLLIVGTSMSAGKTSSARQIIRVLKEAGLRIIGTKLTGAGRYRDILGMKDAGADAIFDFVDVGLPSSVCSQEEYRPRLRRLLAAISAANPDVVVAEAGASPIEPYNGETVLEELGTAAKCTILCASDPYAVVGVIQGFGLQPDLVAGIATSTSAGVALVERLTGVRALNILDQNTHSELRRVLHQKLDLPTRP